MTVLFGKDTGKQNLYTSWNEEERRQTDVCCPDSLLTCQPEGLFHLHQRLLVLDAFDGGKIMRPVFFMVSLY